jgi:hypothetical protein
LKIVDINFGDFFEDLILAILNHNRIYKFCYDEQLLLINLLGLEIGF